MTMETNLQYRLQAGVRFAYGDEFGYAIHKVETGGYTVYVRKVVTTAGVKHTIGQPDFAVEYVHSLKLARRAVELFESGERRTFIDAVTAAYDEETARLRAELEA